MSNPKSDHVVSGKSLLIMPLGDSITEGFGSSDGNGYRLPLLRLLQGRENDGERDNIENNNYKDDDDDGDEEIRFIGSLHSGSMTNNAHEGHGGATIRGITAALRESLRERSPDVVLVHAGTNDLVTQEPPELYETAARQVGELMDEVIETLPEAVVVVAWLMQSSFPRARERVEEFNGRVLFEAMMRMEGGCRVVMANMNAIGKGGTDLADGLHPNDNGYKKMAHEWYSSLMYASEKGWIAMPEHSLAQIANKAPTCLCL